MHELIGWRRIAALCLLLTVVLSGCSRSVAPSPAVKDPQFSRVPPVANWSWFKKEWTSPPAQPTDRTNPFAVDLRLADLRKLDLRQSGDVLMGYALFDTDTQWPQQLPPDYDPKRIMELGRNPGLGVRALHQSGITGKGIHVAFLDQTLLLDHEEYMGRILKYEEIGKVAPQAEMHGAAVTSLLAGKTIGVAPDVPITYYAVQVSAGENKRTFTYLAQGIHRILDDNARRPDAQKIRVIGMSIGWGPQEEGYAEVDQAVRRAKQEGVFVVSTSVEKDYAFKFLGLDRAPLSDPEDYRSYRPGAFWREFIGAMQSTRSSWTGGFSCPWTPAPPPPQQGSPPPRFTGRAG